MRRLWRHLARRRKQQFVLLFGLMIVSGFAEVISLGAVLPFVAIITAPELAFKRPVIAGVARMLGVTSAEHLVLPLTITFAIMAVIAGTVRMLVLWFGTRFALASGADISMEIYRRTLYQSYAVHVARNSSEVISGITAKTGNVVLGIMLPFMTLLSASIVLLAIMAALIAIDPTIALIVTAVFGASYGLITAIIRPRLQRNSRHVADEHTRVVRALQEGMGGIRDVLLDGTQEFYCEVYGRADRVLRRAQSENIVMGQGPRFGMEALGMVLIAALALGLSREQGGVAVALPVLSALALGALRLLPALQQIFGAWANIAGSQASLADTVDLLGQPLNPEQSHVTGSPLRFLQSIRFDTVRFRYTSAGPWVLDGLELSIPKGARLGMVGGTGSGKSTAMDLLMGLLAPVEGDVLVDGEPIRGGRIRAWQQAVAHVPQSIYLADASLSENIAFGVPREAIDLARVRRSAEQAQIADFIESTPEGYEATVGERGVRLSGGQRQRLGIARALYKQASVLILDEATSALDNATERSVMDAIEQLDRNLTIVVIAHRLTTVRHCDTIVVLEQGRVVAQGRYDELIACSPSFRAMVNATKTA
jgi:ATP-binding cassette, subfamily B, bacterial PglK